MPWTNVLRQLFKIQSYGVGVSNALLSLDCILADTSTTCLDWNRVKFHGVHYWYASDKFFSYASDKFFSNKTFGSYCTREVIEIRYIVWWF